MGPEEGRKTEKVKDADTETMDDTIFKQELS